jgi:hypothetical protein
VRFAGLPAVIPVRENQQNLNTRFTGQFVLAHFLQEANFLWSFAKTNNPAWGGVI